MHEIRRQPRMDQIYSERLSKLTGIPQSRWMMASNHPDLGGGFVFSLGHVSTPTTCVKVNTSGYSLQKDGKWGHASNDDIIKWSKDTLESTKSQLKEFNPTEFFQVLFKHS